MLEGELDRANTKSTYDASLFLSRISSIIRAEQLQVACRLLHAWRTNRALDQFQTWKRETVRKMRSSHAHAKDAHTITLNGAKRSAAIHFIEKLLRRWAGISTAKCFLCLKMGTLKSQLKETNSVRQHHSSTATIVKEVIIPTTHSALMRNESKVVAVRMMMHSVYHRLFAKLQCGLLRWRVNQIHYQQRLSSVKSSLNLIKSALQRYIYEGTGSAIRTLKENYVNSALGNAGEQTKQAEMKIRLQKKEQKMKFEKAKFDSATRILKGIKRALQGEPQRDAFTGWAVLTRHTRENRKQQLAFSVFQKFAAGGGGMAGALAKWSRIMLQDKLDLLRKTIGMKLLNKIKARLLMQYAQECIKLWDKRHDLWIADLQEAAKIAEAKKNAGLREISAIVKKFDMQLASARLAVWKQKMRDEQQFKTGTQMMRNIMTGWNKQTKKSMIMTWKAKMRVGQGKEKLNAKREAAQIEFERQSTHVRTEVMKIVEKTQKEAESKYAALKKAKKKLEREVDELMEQNDDLRRRVASAGLQVGLDGAGRGRDFSR